MSLYVFIHVDHPDSNQHCVLSTQQGVLCRTLILAQLLLLANTALFHKDSFVIQLIESASYIYLYLYV